MLGSRDLPKVRTGFAPRSAEASNDAADRNVRAWHRRLVIRMAGDAVPWPIITVVRLSSTPSCEKKLSIETPVMMPGSVIGRITRRRNTVLPGKS